VAWECPFGRPGPLLRLRLPSGLGAKSPFAVGTDAAGNDYVFYGGSDYGLWEKWYIASNSTWYGPGVILKLPGEASAPKLGRR
jgi:hypothetical protein